MKLTATILAALATAALFTPAVTSTEAGRRDGMTHTTTQAGTKWIITSNPGTVLAGATWAKKKF